jgi:uncharacterized membrane protein
MTRPQPQPTPQGGMEPRLAAALSYIWVAAIIFLLLEPYNRNPFVRFHAFQSLFLAVVTTVVSVVLTVTLIGVVLVPFLMLGSLGLLLFCAWKAYNNEWFRVPLIGEYASRQAGA